MKPSMLSFNSIQEIFDTVPQYFRPEAAGETRVLALFEVGGDGGGSWVVEIAGGQLHIGMGTTPAPDFRISASAQTLLDLANRKLNPMTAYMSGQVKITGDLGRAYKLQSLFRMPG